MGVFELCIFIAHAFSISAFLNREVNCKLERLRLGELSSDGVSSRIPTTSFLLSPTSNIQTGCGVQRKISFCPVSVSLSFVKMPTRWWWLSALILPFLCDDCDFKSVILIRGLVTSITDDVTMTLAYTTYTKTDCMP